MNLTVQHAVSSCVDGVPPEQVTAITMAPAEVGAGRRRLRGATFADSTLYSEETLLSYVVTSHDASVTASSLKAQLSEASTTGRLEEALRHYAVVFNAPALTNVTAHALQVTTVHDQPPHSDSAFSSIATITVGAFLALVAIAYAFHLKCVQSSYRINQVLPYHDCGDAYMDAVPIPKYSSKPRPVAG